MSSEADWKALKPLGEMRGRRATPSPASGELASLVERLKTDAEFLARKRGSYPTIGKDCALAASQLAAVAAERDALATKLERAMADLRDISLNCTGRVDPGGLPALVAKCGLEAIATLSPGGSNGQG